MSGSLPFVLVVALSIAHLNPAQSAPLDAPLGSFAHRPLHTQAGHEGGWRFGAADGDTLDLAAAVAPASLSGDAFEDAASRGLASLAAARRPPSLEEIIALASLGSGLYASEAAAGDPSSGNAGVTLRDLAHVLVNRPEAPAGSSLGKQSAPRQGQGGFSLFNAIMTAQLDTEFIETAAEVVAPTITKDGVVALSFLGLRDFAFVVSPLTNRIQVMDFETGTMVTLSRKGYEQTPQPESFSSQQQDSPQRQVQSATPTLTIHTLLMHTKRFLSTYVLHPFTIGSMALFSIFWVMLRIGRRAD